MGNECQAACHYHAGLVSGKTAEKAHVKKVTQILTLSSLLFIMVVKLGIALSSNCTSLV